MAKQQVMFRIFYAIVGRTQRVYCFSEIMSKFMRVNLLSHTRSCVRMANPIGSLILQTDLGGGRISFSNFVLKLLYEEDDVIIGVKSFFHSERQ